MENLNSPQNGNPTSSPAVSVPLSNPLERMLRILSAAGCLGGTLLVVIALLPQPEHMDLLLLISGCVLLLVSAAVLVTRGITSELRAQFLVLSLFVLIQVLFTRFGWSGQALLPWLAFVLVSSALLSLRSSRIWIALGIISLLVWFMLAATNQLHQVIVITQNSLLIDAALILAVAAIGVFLISVLKQSQISTLAEWENTRRANLVDLETAQMNLIEMENHLVQNQVAKTISNTLNRIRDPQQLIQKAADLIRASFDLYYVGVFLIDPAHEYAVLKYGTGEEGRRMTANRHRLAVGGYSMIGWTTQTHRSRVALDVGEEAVHFDNPELPETRSELSLPLQTENGILGALTIQSSQPNAFLQDQIDLLQGIVDSLAVALENANAFDRTQKSLDEIRVLNQAFVQQTWGEKLSHSGALKATYDNPQARPSSDQSATVKVPLVLRNEVIGYINLDVEGGQLQPDQLEFLQAISSQTSTAIENARLIEETQRAAAQEQKLNQISTQFSQALTIDEILRTAVTEFGNLPSVTEASISLIPPDDLENGEYTGFDTEVNS